MALVGSEVAEMGAAWAWLNCERRHQGDKEAAEVVHSHELGLHLRKAGQVRSYSHW